MTDRTAASLFFYETLQIITDTFEYVQARRPDFDEEIDAMFERLECVADRTLAIASTQDWGTAIRTSGIREVWDDCQCLFEDFMLSYLPSPRNRPAKPN